jgi:hypothetical protein
VNARPARRSTVGEATSGAVASTAVDPMGVSPIQARQ